MSFEGSARFVAEAIVGSADGPSVANAMPIACRFVELALQPISFQAIYGVDTSQLMTDVDRHIDDAIVLLTASGFLKG